MDNENFENLYKTITSINDAEVCQKFFEDLATPKELKDLSDRLLVAKLLIEGLTYESITKQTGMSSTTIARINKTLLYGQGGYKKVLKNK